MVFVLFLLHAGAAAADHSHQLAEHAAALAAARTAATEKTGKRTETSAAAL